MRFFLQLPRRVNDCLLHWQKKSKINNPLACNVFCAFGALYFHSGPGAFHSQSGSGAFNFHFGLGACLGNLAGKTPFWHFSCVFSVPVALKAWRFSVHSGLGPRARLPNPRPPKDSGDMFLQTSVVHLLGGPALRTVWQMSQNTFFSIVCADRPSNTCQKN